jgi:N-methylhydantoinase A
MQANGGIMSAQMACEKSVNTVLSGPAAGVIAASYITRQSGHSQVVTCDMGGTSFDAGIIVNGVPLITSDRDLEFNLPMRIPIIDIHTIGAGGGSIARLTEAGMIEVGPRSAGATPGPIAYGRGGRQPTVTDANVLLGRLSAEQLLAVQAKIDLPAIREAFAALGKPLNLSAEQTAASVLRIVNDSMAGAIRFVTLQRGRDPREFALFVFGGAGPLHGAALWCGAGARPPGADRDRALCAGIDLCARMHRCRCPARLRADHRQAVVRHQGRRTARRVAPAARERS